MGGRGASSGLSSRGNEYGTQYKEYFTSGNVKFVSKIDRNSETLMETMTSGRVYAIIGGESVKEITYFDSKGKRVKSINLGHKHKGLDNHVHHGYLHNENDGLKGAARLTPKEIVMVDKVLKDWENYKKRNRK